MGEVRECVICGRLVRHKVKRYRTCGSPRCVRMNRARPTAERKEYEKARKTYAEMKRGSAMADTVARAQIEAAWKSVQDMDMIWSDRLIFVCRAANVTPAVAISTLKSLGLV